MAMKTNIRTENDNVIISIEGFLDYETTDSLKKELFTLQKNVANNQVIFDLGALQFVGSSGIAAFVQTLRDFNTRAGRRPRYTNVKSEFKRIMNAFDETGSFDFWDTTERAVNSFQVDN